MRPGSRAGPRWCRVAREYLAPLTDAGVDTVILGCTHYPMLAGAIGYVMGEDVTLVDSATETAIDVYRALAANGLEAPTDSVAAHRFFATGPHESFEALAQRFLGPVVTQVEAL